MIKNTKTIKSRLMESLNADKRKLLQKLILEFLILRSDLVEKLDDPLCRALRTEIKNILGKLLLDSGKANKDESESHNKIATEIADFFYKKKNPLIFEDLIDDVESTYRRFRRNGMLGHLYMTWSEAFRNMGKKIAPMLKISSQKYFEEMLSDTFKKKSVLEQEKTVSQLKQEYDEQTTGEYVLSNKSGVALWIIPLIISYWIASKIENPILFLVALIGLLPVVGFIFIQTLRITGLNKLDSGFFESSLCKEKYYDYVDFLLETSVLFEKHTKNSDKKDKKSDVNFNELNTKEEIRLHEQSTIVSSETQSERRVGNEITKNINEMVIREKREQSHDYKEDSEKRMPKMKNDKHSIRDNSVSNKKLIKKYRDCDLSFFENKKTLAVNNYLSSRYHPRVRKVWGKSINSKRNLFLVFSYDHVKKLIKDDGARKIFLEIVKDAHAVPSENCQGIVIEKEDVKAKTLDSMYGRYRLLFNKQEPKIISCESKEDLPEEDLSANEYYVPSAYGDFHK